MERENMRLQVGWYSREDMKSCLKWNQNLRSIDNRMSNIRPLSLINNRRTNVGSLASPRKKIEGAIKVCMEDEETLVRQGWLIKLF